MTGRLRWGALLLTALFVATSGCAMAKESPVDESLTVADAKAIAQEVELEIAAMVPAELVSHVEQKPTGIFMSCRGEGVYQWAGGTRVYLTEPVDVGSVVVAAAEELDAREEWVVKLDDSNGMPNAVVRGAHGAVYIFSQWEEQMVWISSWSPCFRLPDYLWPGDDY